ncbi:MAG: hypothetical protein AAF439_16165 [Pseudomonadota bacterium]
MDTTTAPRRTFSQAEIDFYVAKGRRERSRALAGFFTMLFGRRQDVAGTAHAAC